MIYKCPNLKFPLAIIKPAEYLLHGEQWSKLLADFSCGLYCSIPAALQSLLKQTKNTATRARCFSVRMTLKLKSIFHSGLALADSQIRARQYFAHKVYIYWILQYSTRFRKLTVTLFILSCCSKCFIYNKQAFDFATSTLNAVECVNCIKLKLYNPHTVKSVDLFQYLLMRRAHDLTCGPLTSSPLLCS